MFLKVFHALVHTCSGPSIIVKTCKRNNKVILSSSATYSLSFLVHSAMVTVEARGREKGLLGNNFDKVYTNRRMDKSRVGGSVKSKQKSQKKQEKDKSKHGGASLVPEANKPKPKKTEIDVTPFAIRIVNTITYNQTKLTITKKFTVKEIHEAYAPFESNPELYLWQDMYGKTLELNKTVVENGLMEADEIVEFDGIGKEPVILLVFKDGFEEFRLPTLNPVLLHAPKDWEEGICRNY